MCFVQIKKKYIYIKKQGGRKGVENDLQNMPGQECLASTGQENIMIIIIRGFLERPSNTLGASTWRLTITLTTHTHTHTQSVGRGDEQGCEKQFRNNY